MAQPAFFDEMTAAGGDVRAVYARISRWLDESPPELLAARREQAEMMFRRIGITFAVYGDKEATERLIPFDIIPRVLSRTEWNRLEKGLVQRVKALNAFLADLYGKGDILRAGVVPSDIIYRNPASGRRWRAVLSPITSTFILRASTSCGWTTTISMCWKTTPAPPPGSPTCWRTAR